MSLVLEATVSITRFRFQIAHSFLHRGFMMSEFYFAHLKCFFLHVLLSFTRALSNGSTYENMIEP